MHIAETNNFPFYPVNSNYDRLPLAKYKSKRKASKTISFLNQPFKLGRKQVKLEVFEVLIEILKKIERFIQCCKSKKEAPRKLKKSKEVCRIS